MNFNSIRYLINEGFKNIRINLAMSLASIGIMVACLVLTGCSILFSYNIMNIVKDLQGENVVNVFLKQDTPAKDSENTKQQLLAIENIATATFISKKDALEKYNNLLKHVFDGIGEKDNFLPDSYKITMKDLSLYDETIEAVKKISTVDIINDKSDAAMKLSGLNKIVSFIGFWIVLILTIISLFIISNTIRSAMYNRRLEINIMKSVGATNAFIRIPFLIESFVLGVIAAAISFVLLKVIYDNVVIAINQMLPFEALPFSDFSSFFVACFGCGSIFFCLVGGSFSIARFLHKEGEEIIGI